jgi:hypothetical protein
MPISRHVSVTSVKEVLYLICLPLEGTSTLTTEYLAGPEILAYCDVQPESRRLFTVDSNLRIDSTCRYKLRNLDRVM